MQALYPLSLFWRRYHVLAISKFTIRTSDRRVFRRCLRKWGYYSSIKMNLQRKGTEQNINFWFGSGIHFAMEDYHGWNHFGDPRRAFKAYYDAFDSDTLPENAPMMYDLGIGMLNYYLEWYPRHNKEYGLETIWFNDKMEVVPAGTEGAHPAVEQQFFLNLGIVVVVDKQTEQILCEYDIDMESTESSTFPQIMRTQGFNFDNPETPEEQIFYRDAVDSSWIEVELVPMYYHGTFDRLVVDRLGRWWILDYKTAKGADTNKLATDDQISAYLWAAEQWFGHPIYGFIYLQLTKDVPHPPKRLKNGEMSVDKKQKTTYALAREEIIKEYGSVAKAPNKYVEFLNILAEKEMPEGDRFIRWDFVTRTQNQKIATYNNIMGEVRIMINPNLYLFPNPTRDCIWDCPLRDICLAYDDARYDEVEYTLQSEYEYRPRGEDGNQDEWREKIVWPANALPPVDENEFKLDLEQVFCVNLDDAYDESDD